MTSQRYERRLHFRGKGRPGRRVELRYRPASAAAGAPAITAFTRNIGVGGAFIVTDAPEPVGRALLLSLRMPTSQRAIEIAAEVRWVAPAAGAGDCGMGVKFRDLDVDELIELSAYFASLTGTVVDL
jgi:uncharacterized protein (TIGR02266 family)